MFLAGLVVLLVVFERVATRRVEATDGQSLTTRDVYRLPGLARRPSNTVTRVYLGDSVARQFYPAESEPNDSVRFLTSNGGLSIAGSYYLLEEVFRACPNARDAVLLVRPETLQVNLDPPYANDFFAGLFHSRQQVVEILRVKRDLRLSAAHFGRWMLPNTMAINGAWRQEPDAFLKPFFERVDASTLATPVAPPPPAVEHERMLMWIGELFGGERSWRTTFPKVDVATPVQLSPIAEHFLAKLRALCASRGGTLRVLSTPYPEQFQWADPTHIFDAPILYLPTELFGDHVHVGPKHVWLPTQVGSDVARQLAEHYGLKDLAIAKPQ